MARRARVKFVRNALRAIREDPNVQRDLVDRAQRIADGAGGEARGYIVRDNLAREGRSGASVIDFGYQKNHQDLLRNLPRGR